MRRVSMDRRGLHECERVRARAGPSAAGHVRRDLGGAGTAGITGAARRRKRACRAAIDTQTTDDKHADWRGMEADTPGGGSRSAAPPLPAHASVPSSRGVRCRPSASASPADMVAGVPAGRPFAALRGAAIEERGPVAILRRRLNLALAMACQLWRYSLSARCAAWRMLQCCAGGLHREGAEAP